jgi:hypothetical protein
MKNSKYFMDVPRGGKRTGSGRKAGKRSTETVQLTARVQSSTLAKIRAEADRRLEPGQKQPNVGKVIDDLAEKLPEVKNEESL